jgi:hypothetical protein
MKELNDKQRLFLEVLFRDKDDGGAEGDFVLAKKLAGYHPSYSTKMLVEAIKEEIEQSTKDYFVQVAPKAAVKIAKLLDNPTTMGAKELLSASKELLDRAGIVKTDKIDITGSGGIFILPPKDE